MSQSKGGVREGSSSSLDDVTWISATEGDSAPASFKDLCQLQSLAPDTDAAQIPCVGILFLHASWNPPSMVAMTFQRKQFLIHLLREAARGYSCQKYAGSVPVDSNEESLDFCVGDDCEEQHDETPIPPEEFPALALIAQSPDTNHAVLQYVTGFRPHGLLQILDGDPSVSLHETHRLLMAVEKTVKELLEPMLNGREAPTIQDEASSGDEPLRIFVAGDRSSAGKSSICLGILGALVHMGYAPSDLAYIKPATQSESTQLIQLYCQAKGIACVPIGPLVYYRGFTRAFLAGETESTDELLVHCGRAVDQIARGKRVVLVDGVGFPAVGSICGTDNACVARACGYRVSSSTSSADEQRRPMGVVLVGGSGVGGAVDAFNLNTAYFEKANVPVLGAIFNKLSTEGFYSLENCKRQVTAYFDQSSEHQSKGRRPFGFVPLVPEIAGADVDMKTVDEYFRIFASHVDVPAIIQGATQIKQDVSATSASTPVSDENGSIQSPVKRQKMATAANNNNLNQSTAARMRTRAEIERQAIQAGAAPSA